MSCETALGKALSSHTLKEGISMSQAVVRVGVTVIIEQAGRILLCLRKGEHAEGTWGFPGGHLELGETPEEGAAREAMEEAGVELANLRRYAFTNDFFDESGKHYITIFMKAELPDGQEVKNMEPHKCDRWEWFDADDLPEPLMLPIVNLLKDGYALIDPAKQAA